MNHVSLEEWLLTAEVSCQPSSPFLVILCGLSGSGKSTVSQFLAETWQAAWIRSDIERKRLFGLKPDQSSNSLKKNIYSPEVTKATFNSIGVLAEQLLTLDYPVIIDSCALKCSERALFRTISQQKQVMSLTVYCFVSPETLIERVSIRQHTGTDPSEASVSLISKQQSWLEKPSKNETLALINLDTEDTLWQKNLIEAINSLILSHSYRERR